MTVIVKTVPAGWSAATANTDEKLKVIILKDPLSTEVIGRVWDVLFRLLVLVTITVQVVTVASVISDGNVNVI